MVNSVDPDQTAPIRAVCSGSTLFASIPNSSAMLGNSLQQTTATDDFFRCILFLGALSVNYLDVTLTMKLNLFYSIFYFLFSRLSIALTTRDAFFTYTYIADIMVS